LDVSTFAAVPDAGAILAKVIFGHTARAGDVVPMHCHSQGVSHDAVCGLLIGRLQDVGACFVCFIGSFIDNYVYIIHRNRLFPGQ
jgi:hypothetical protein